MKVVRIRKKFFDKAGEKERVETREEKDNRRRDIIERLVISENK